MPMSNQVAPADCGVASSVPASSRRTTTRCQCEYERRNERAIRTRNSTLHDVRASRAVGVTANSNVSKIAGTIDNLIESPTLQLNRVRMQIREFELVCRATPNEQTNKPFNNATIILLTKTAFAPRPTSLHRCQARGRQSNCVQYR